MYPCDAPVVVGEDIVSFGSFKLSCTARTLTCNGTPIAIGNRAMDILLALTERAGRIVSNRELHELVWPNVVVGDGSIRVHVATLRKILRDAEPNSDFVHNVTGRGYRFVAPVMRAGRPAEALPALSSSTVLKLPLRAFPRRNNLPPRRTSVIGRDRDTRRLAELVACEGFVTVTGPGGCGKTTVAIATAASLVAAYANGVCYLDLAAAKRSEIWSMLATALSVSLVSEDPMSEVLTCLSKQSVLILMDNCEAMIEVATQLAETMLRSCPQVNILATSREPLRACGEVVHVLAPLDLPASFDASAAQGPMDCSAIHLFVERCGAHADGGMDEKDLPLAASICRRLEGNPLAIEIAATQVRWLGLRSLSAGLQDVLLLSMEGCRSAERRHQTLRASFDWSYDQLPDVEQRVFRRLSVFAGCFDQERAIAVVADGQLPSRVVLECLMNLARKSLILVDTAGHDVLYRMSSLARAYAREKLHEAQELSLTHRRHLKAWNLAHFENVHAHARLWQMAQHSERGLCDLTTIPL